MPGSVLSPEKATKDLQKVIGQILKKRASKPKWIVSDGLTDRL